MKYDLLEQTLFFLYLLECTDVRYLMEVMERITVPVSLYLMDQAQVSNQANNVSGDKKITIFKTIDLQNLETDFKCSSLL